MARYTNSEHCWLTERDKANNDGSFGLRQDDYEAQTLNRKSGPGCVHQLAMQRSAVKFAWLVHLERDTL